MKSYNNTKNVYDAAIDRLEIIFKEFDNIFVSFSAGKDSGVMVQMALEVAEKHNKLPLNVLFIDLEAQYKHTIDFAKTIMNNPKINPYWICLPLHLRNAVSQFQPHWLCWDIEKKDAWVRELPENSISDNSYFPFFRKGMEFEEFVISFADWFSNNKKTACLVGIRSDESLNRFRTIASESKITYQKKQWSTKLFPETNKGIYNFYPIYDWKTEDVWTANGKFNYEYNKVYDLMYLAGLSIHQMRICQPYGDDQRKGLYLFKILEPETWAKVVNRVQGANYGNRYSENDKTTLGNYKVNLPPNHTYESYAKFLLDTMPLYLKEHYMKKINKFWDYWKKEGFDVIPDKSDPKLEAQKKAPSWRRICKVLLKNDYWCKGLSFSQTKHEMEKQIEIINKYMNVL
jgi:predicted phosphoadenosine phosphosulfate sulfurtransferase